MSSISQDNFESIARLRTPPAKAETPCQNYPSDSFDWVLFQLAGRARGSYTGVVESCLFL